MRWFKRTRREPPDEVKELSNRELGYKIVNATRRRDELVDLGLNPGPTELWLGRLTDEFYERKDNGTWSLEES